MPVTPIDSAGPTRVAYATIADVQGVLPARPITASSIPSEDQVGRFLELTAADIDSIIARRGYALPVPDTAVMTLAVLCYGNTLGGRARTEAAAQVPSATGAAAEWLAWRRELQDGQIELPDLRAEAPPRARGRAAAGATPFFRRDMEF